MALTAGTRLGPYEVLAPLGAGSSALYVNPDGRGYVYEFANAFSNLWLIEGLKP